MRYREPLSEPEKDLLKLRIDDASAVEAMLGTEGWRLVSANLKELEEALAANNATEAADWDDYRTKAARIWAMRLLLSSIEDFRKMGKDAEETLEEG